jgi:hypothetical protein
MLDFLRLLLHSLAAPFHTQAQLEAEITMLRHQLSVLRRQAPSTPRLTSADRLLFVLAVPPVSVAAQRHHDRSAGHCAALASSGFWLYWRWKSRSRGGRPKVAIEIRSLIRG